MAKVAAKDSGERGGLRGAPSRERLEHTSIRLHPDVMRAILKKAATDRRKPTDVMRELISKGLAADGIYL